ncbi:MULTISPECIES: CopD family protein [unclassified Streptomyces]|uniref:CopD family protein n=1 Tax=unclassified Streptomyces TaxID=2593676 RepID=UPI0016607344|nr:MULTISPECIES: CopD family protein [unclassified Streptomyces]MBD0710647.1 copper resistance protein CopD [Streptomyces sp. CBMA291]MBD0715494.1 copper resistance protein CopD [Streptomyces sp. CBMA370]
MTLPGPFGTPSRLTAAVIAAVAVLGVALLGAGLAQTGTGELRIPASGTTTLLRLLVLTGLAVSIGETTGRRLAGAGPRPRALAAPAALLAAAASAALLLLFTAVSGLSPVVVYGLREGRLLLATANACVLAALCAASRRPGLAALPLAVAVGAEAMRAHPETAPLLGTCLTLVHLTAACLWTGTLLYVLRTMRLRDGGRDVLVRYARMAAWVYAALAVTGTVSTLRKLPLDAVLNTAYGRILLVKLALFGGASLLALAARGRMRSGADARSPARVEVAVLGAIVLVSALLTVVPDPHGIVP